MESSANESSANRLQMFLNTYSINNDNLYNIPDKTGSIQSQYPVRMLGGQPDDTKWATRKALVNAQGVVPGIGMAIAGPDYDDYANRKRIEVTGAEFKAWLTNNVDLSTPEKQEYYFNMFPFLRDDRLAEVDRQAALQKKMAEINIRGVHSEDDFFFVYALQQGYITVSDVPLQNLWQKETGSTYQGGLFSIVSKKLFPEQKNFRNINYELPTNPTGTGIGTTPSAYQGVFRYNDITGNIPNTPGAVPR